MSTAPECTSATEDVDCDRPSLYVVHVQHRSGTHGEMLEFACEDHVDDVAGDGSITSVSPIGGVLTPESVTTSTLADEKREPQYRPSKWSSPWALLIPLLGYELWAVATGKQGGPLSHLVWWAYGDRWSLRWWVASMMMNGLGVWAAVHFMFEWPDWRHLLICLVVGLALGLVAWGVPQLVT